MLTVQLPTMLAVLGTVLMAIVIFAPAPAAAAVTTSFAPSMPPPLDHWQPPLSGHAIGEDPFDDAPLTSMLVHEPVIAGTPSWPSLVDPSAHDCDAASRRSLIEALATVRTSWAAEILHRAEQEETDPLVLEALQATRATLAVHPGREAYRGPLSEDVAADAPQPRAGR